MAAHQPPLSWDSPGKNTGVGCHFLLQCMTVKRESEVAQSCPTLSDAMDHSLPGSSIHGIFQARVLECVAIAFWPEINTTNNNEKNCWELHKCDKETQCMQMLLEKIIDLLNAVATNLQLVKNTVALKCNKAKRNKIRHAYILQFGNVRVCTLSCSFTFNALWPRGL